MKNYNYIIIVLITLISIFSCAQSTSLKKEVNNYNIYKLDSINNYYLIYAKKKDSLFKIVSKKEKIENCKAIRLNYNYNLTLHSMLSQAPVINGVKINPVNYMDMQCFGFDKNTNICKEEGIYDLYFTDNLKGLCYFSH